MLSSSSDGLSQDRESAAHGLRETAIGPEAPGGRAALSAAATASADFFPRPAGSSRDKQVGRRRPPLRFGPKVRPRSASGSEIAVTAAMGAANPIQGADHGAR